MLRNLLRGAFRRREPGAQERYDRAVRLEQQKRLTEAVRQYTAVLALGAESAAVHAQLANCYARLGRGAEAVPHYRRAAELDPRAGYVEHSVLGALNFVPDITPEAVFEAHRAWGERLMASVRPVLQHSRSNERIRVGYVSPDLRRHPVTYLFAPVLEHHDRARFEIYCYDPVGDGDAVTVRLKRASEHWREVAGRSDEAIAETVNDDRIDILVDLAGHTTHSRLRAFAMKPAPVQVSWLGYFNTTGLPTMDYFISDPHSSPEGQQRWFSESLWRLPHTRFPYEPPAFAPEVGRLPARARGGVTFGCFNNLSKVNDRVIALWARVLDAVPGSRVKIVAIGLHDEGNREYWRERFASRGIAPDRVELSPFLPHEALLAAYGEVDIALDPFPFAGGLTSLEALYMGVPVVTLEAPMLPGRQTISFLRNVGLETLVAADEEAYVAAAVQLADDLDALAALRASLRERMRASPLMDYAAFTRDLEKAYEQMLDVVPDPR
ncbi:MAG TPA: tetratricopeptide repeat protein [Burkholderiales bacterium]|nr:tetratricopeptide repeat protein [Burkholderiales bacterium]